MDTPKMTKIERVKIWTPPLLTFTVLIMGAVAVGLEAQQIDTLTRQLTTATDALAAVRQNQTARTDIADKFYAEMRSDMAVLKDRLK